MRPSSLLAFAIASLVAAGACAAPPSSAVPASATQPAASAPAHATTHTRKRAAAHAGKKSSKPAAKPLTADQQRMRAVEQYQHDLVSVVALRNDAAYLLGAAILAKPFEQQTPGLDFDSLSQRAAAAPAASPAALWARLDLCKDKHTCPNAGVFAALKKDAPDNAAVWIVAMDVASMHKDAKAERAAFLKAAAASTYDDYYGKALGGVVKATAVLPPLPDTTAGAHDGQPDNPDGVRVLVSYMALRSHLRPMLDPVLKLCDAKALGDDNSLTKPCLALAHTLQWGSSPVARAAGLHIQSAIDPAKQPQDATAARNLAWQVKQFSALSQAALTDPTRASQWLADAGNGGTELSLILATLRANNVPAIAPDADPTPDAAPAPASSTH